jgi:hypothetical protein
LNSGDDSSSRDAQGQSYEIKVELKKHILLGEPIKSDWK